MQYWWLKRITYQYIIGKDWQVKDGGVRFFTAHHILLGNLWCGPILLLINNQSINDVLLAYVAIIYVSPIWYAKVARHGQATWHRIDASHGILLMRHMAPLLYLATWHLFVISCDTSISFHLASFSSATWHLYFVRQDLGITKM